MTEFPVPTPSSRPYQIVAGPDGNLWFTEEEADIIGMITVDGLPSEFPTQNCCFPTFITTGMDGRLWFTEELPGQIGAISTDGSVEYFTPPTAELLYGITTGPDGAAWFTGLAGTYKLGKVQTDGQITEILAPTVLTGIAGVTTGPDGNIWIAESQSNAIGRLDLGS